MNLYNFQENLFLFSRNFTIWIGLQLVSQSDSFQALGSCFCEKYTNMYIVQCIDYIGYSTRTLCAVCEECSVFAKQYKYIVEGLRKTIRRTKIIDLSF